MTTMPRTRATRRANTARHAARRRHLADTDLMCSGKCTPNGEAKECPRCSSERWWNTVAFEMEVKARDAAWWLAQE